MYVTLYLPTHFLGDWVVSHIDGCVQSSSVEHSSFTKVEKIVSNIWVISTSLGNSKKDYTIFTGTLRISNQYKGP